MMRGSDGEIAVARPASSVRFRSSDIRRAINSVSRMGFDEVRVAIRLDGAIEVTVRYAIADDTMGVDLT